MSKEEDIFGENDPNLIQQFLDKNRNPDLIQQVLLDGSVEQDLIQQFLDDRKKQTILGILGRIAFNKKSLYVLLAILISSPFFLRHPQNERSLYEGRYSLADASLSEKIFLDSDIPTGSPLGDANIVVTQGYGIGSHAPAEAWGGIDLAVDVDGNGIPEPESTLRIPIYATHDGYVRIVPNSWPAGNYISIENEKYRTAYAHLYSYEEGLSDGDFVKRGDVIGYVGSTGMSSGPHLHYEIWEKKPGKGWENQNPLEPKYASLTKQSELYKKIEDKVSISVYYDSNLYLGQRQELENQFYIAYKYVLERLVGFSDGVDIKMDIKVSLFLEKGCGLHALADTSSRHIAIYTCDKVPIERVTGIFSHEVGHQIAQDFYGQSHLDADHILLEGFATWLAGKYWLGDNFQNFRDFVRENYLHASNSPFAVNAYGRSYQEMNALYYKWASFVEFLIEEYGWEKFNRLYKSGQKVPGSANYLNIYGKNLDELIFEWNKWLH